MMKKLFIITTIISLIAGLSRLNSADSNPIPGTVSFMAVVNLSGKVEIRYSVIGSEQEKIALVYLKNSEGLVLGENVSPNFITLSSFDEKKSFFPNDMIISVTIDGILKHVTSSVNGEAFIPREDVRPPGIEYFVVVQDAQLHVTRSQRIIVPVSLSQNAKLTPSGGTIIFPDTNPHDGDVHLVFPPGAVSQDIEITVTLEEAIALYSQGSPLFSGSAGSNSPVVVYDFSSTKHMPEKSFEVSLLYRDNDSTPGIVDGTNINELDLAIYWHDGFEWRPLGGTVNPEDNLITVTMGHFARLGIFPAAPLSKDQYRPKRKIITPALADGTNDFAQFDNLAGRTDVAIKIFDITGRKIRTIHAPYIWNGRDDDGDIVESGVYIYQFDVDGTLISGTIAVAK